MNITVNGDTVLQVLYQSDGSYFSFTSGSNFDLHPSTLFTEGLLRQLSHLTAIVTTIIGREYTRTIHTPTKISKIFIVNEIRNVELLQ